MPHCPAGCRRGRPDSAAAQDRGLARPDHGRIRTADGLRQTEPGWMGLARTMNAARWQVLTSWVACRQPSLASRLRMVPVVAPIGTVVGGLLRSGLSHADGQYPLPDRAHVRRAARAGGHGRGPAVGAAAGARFTGSPRMRILTELL
ncbi:hypothetical protein ACOZ4Y_04155 [Komagataeibacter rhaeticus]|uniref:hypothetical protein n=1 Tax=Komagataeibacter rhaeticus TaxID=215221 RepID=UPI0012EB4B42|nr:hypothetical protein [Komagataeibacter rhaeticus]